MKYVKQFSIILGISFLAELLEVLIPLPIAASVYGLVIMLVGLITKLIPLERWRPRRISSWMPCPLCSCPLPWESWQV